jgi:hypothetical protein
MRRLFVATAIAAQLSSFASPALASEPLADHGAAVTRHGGFVGARLRVSLGARQTSRVTAGLTLAPVVQREGFEGVTSRRLGEGMELGFGSDRKPYLAMAGRTLDLSGRQSGAGPKLGVSTGVWILGGVAVLAGVGALIYFSQDCERIFHDNQDCSD